jgi:hypothetical protein
MRLLFFVLALITCMGAFDPVFAQVPPLPQAGNVGAAGAGMATVVSADVTPAVDRTGKIALVAGIIVTMLTQLMKSSAFGGWLKTVDRQKRILVPIGLSALSGLLTQWLTGMCWQDACWTAAETAGMSILAAEGVLASWMGLRTGDGVPKTPSVEPTPPTPTTPSAT